RPSDERFKRLSKGSKGRYNDVLATRVVIASTGRPMLTRGRRFTSPLYPSGSLIFCSTTRTRNKMKTTHRDHHWNRQGTVSWAHAQSRFCNHTDGPPKIRRP